VSVSIGHYVHAAQAVSAADLVVEETGKLAELETRDTGKIIRETSAQIADIADYYLYYAGIADKIDVRLRREPIGVVAMVMPWNSQLVLSAVKIGPAVRGTGMSVTIPCIAHSAAFKSSKIS
jgi:acyl-CoA reductase-like NAD-dependent aldehyde dehydrogenase